MKTIINSLKTKQSEKFRCDICGCIFSSNEYKIEHIEKTKIELSDKCPDCKNDVYETIFR